MTISIETPMRRRRFVPRRAQRRAGFTAVLAMLLGAPLLAFVGPAQAVDPDGVGPRDPEQRSFPAYYTDDAGTVLQLCDDGSANCLLARPRDLAPPEGEAFYWVATGELTAPGIDLNVEFAIEAAWLDGQQQVFDRLRIRGHVDEAGTYTLTHPYGTTTVEAADPVERRNVNFTEDVGCEPVAGARCDFAALATSPDAHVTTFLQSTDPPAGYLGRGEVAGPATIGEDGLPASMSVAGPAGTAATTDFAIMGKLANPRAVSMRRTLDFGNVRGRRSNRVRVINIGTQPLTLGTVRFTGSPTLRRFSTPNACGPGDVLAVGRRCTVGIRYRPDGRRRSAATLRITDDTPRGLRTVRVTAKTAAVLAAPRRIRFAARRGGTSGPTRRIVLTNTGSARMVIRGVALRGRNVRNFDRRRGAPRVCARGVRVPVGGQCAIYVGFEPRGFGSRRAGFIVRTNALGGPRTIRLSGRAR